MPRTGKSKARTPKPRHESEERAAAWYRSHGYRILETNKWVAGYELDLIVQHAGVLVFCEVKSKQGTMFGDPLEMVTPEKIRRIRRSAEAWLAFNPGYERSVVRFDVVAVRGNELECLQNAF